MSFIGPKLLQKIDMRLHEAFPNHSQLPFGGRSIMIFGDLGQLPLVKDIPMYASKSYGASLWRSFTKVLTLSKIFWKIGEEPAQVTFHTILSNLCNVEPTTEDWQVLMTY